MSSHTSEAFNNAHNHENPQLYKAITAGDLEAVKVLVQQVQAQDDATELFERSLQEGLNAAICSKHASIVSYLLDHDAKLDEWYVGVAVTSDAPAEVYQAFLDHGWDINERTFTGSPALKHIVPDEALVGWFLSHGADPNVRGRWNEAPITVACCCSTREVVDLLLAHGASLHHSDALHLVAEDEEHRPESVRMMSHLLGLGMDVNEISHTEYPEARGRGFFTPLHTAAGADFAEAITFLLKRGADREIKNTPGVTPLEHAIDCGNEAAIEALRKH